MATEKSKATVKTDLRAWAESITFSQKLCLACFVTVNQATYCEDCEGMFRDSIQTVLRTARSPKALAKLDPADRRVVLRIAEICKEHPRASECAALFVA